MDKIVWFLKHIQETSCLHRSQNQKQEIDEKENQEVGMHKQSETNSHLKNKRDDK